MQDDARPAWARRLAAERRARGWTQHQTTEAMRQHADRPLPDAPHLLRMWKNWERGRHRPRPEYQRLIAAAFGTVSAAVFGPDAVPGSHQAPPSGTEVTADSTLELVERIRRSDLDRAALDTLAITVERLCSGYAVLPPTELRREARAWMARLVGLLHARLTLDQHREVLVFAGWLALLVGCLEYDAADRGSAEATCRAAARLGHEAGHAVITAWAQEMTCWFALTQGDYRQVVESARTGGAMAPHASVSVQLAGQEAKAWARIGDRRQVDHALARGRALLESLPYPGNPDNHFTVDPDKFDFYAMDCHRRVGDDALAALHAREVIRKSTAPDGSLRSPMRAAEAHTTLAVVSARAGDLDGAIAAGTTAIDIPRQSVPSLLAVMADLVDELRDRYPGERAVAGLAGRVASLAAPPRAP